MKHLYSIIAFGSFLITISCTRLGDSPQNPNILPENQNANRYVQKQNNTGVDEDTKNILQKLTETTTDKPDKATALSFQIALARTLKKNPLLVATLLEINSKEGLIIQSKLWQNPEISLGVEHLFGKNGSNAVESQIQISQVIELGGKIKRRSKVAEAEKSVAIQEALSTRIEVLAEVSLLFMDVVENQFKWEQELRNAEIAKSIYDVVNEKVKAGKVSPLEEKKALLVLNQSQLRLNQTISSFNSSKIKLVKMWGSQAVDFEKVDYQLGFVDEPPAFTEFEKQIINSPAVLLGQLKVELEEQRATLERANATPDLSVNTAFQKYEENSDKTFALGVSIPLTIFNRNQGNIKSADALKMKARAESTNTNNTINSELIEMYNELQTSHKKLITLKKDIYPAAKSVFDDAQIGYQKGSFDFLTVLDAQRSLFEINVDLIETEIELKKKLIKTNSLVGKIEIIK